MKRTAKSAAWRALGQQPYEYLRSASRGVRRRLRGWRRWRRVMERMSDVRPPSFILADPAAHVWAGYYDITPFNDAEDKVLAIRADVPLRSPLPSDVAEIGYYRPAERDRAFRALGETATWNWQQGSRARWILSGDGEERVLYNTLVGGNYGSVVRHAHTGAIEHSWSSALYDLSRSGKEGLTLNFSRLQRLRPGYGYGVLEDASRDRAIPDDDGVWHVDLIENRRRLMFSLAELAAIEPDRSMDGAHHYINHLSINPSGTACIFFHLWLDLKEDRRYTRLLSARMDGHKLTLLNNSGFVSHYTWISDDRFVVTTRVSNRETRHCTYHVRTGFEGIIGNEAVRQDGHPSMIRGGAVMITDTYPDSFRDQRLLAYNLEAKRLWSLDRFHTPREFGGEVRCDLHPRVSPSETRVCCDIVVDGRRAMVVHDIGETRL